MDVLLERKDFDKCVQLVDGVVISGLKDRLKGRWQC